jgi:hypothetical protein
MGMNQEHKTNAGFLYGAIFALLIVVIHVVVDGMNYWSSQADLFLWGVQLVFYFIAGIAAANSQYKVQINDDDPLLGIVSQGRGAAMIIAACSWVYIIIRSLALDDAGMFAGISFILFVGFMIIDFLLAIALGHGGGRIIEKQHAPVEEY